MISADDQRACCGSGNGCYDGCECGRLSSAPLQRSSLPQWWPVRPRGRCLQVSLSHWLR